MITGDTTARNSAHNLIARFITTTRTLPLSKLPQVVTEARAMGIAVLAAVQATSLFARRYGSDGMTELREVD